MDLLAHQVWQSLDLDLLAGAEFLAEQILANSDNAISRYVLATVQFRLQKYETAKLTVKEHLDTLECVWIYAKCCLKLNEGRHGVYVLDQIKHLWDVDNDLPLSSVYGRCELNAAGFHLLRGQLLGILNENTNSEAALEEYAKSAKLNPFLIENVLPLAESVDVNLHAAALFSQFEDPFNAQPVKESTMVSQDHAEEVSEDMPPIIHKSALTSTPRRIESNSHVLTTPLLPQNQSSAHIPQQLFTSTNPNINPGETSTNHNATFTNHPHSPLVSSKPIFQPATSHTGLLQTPMHVPSLSSSAAPPQTNRRRQERIFSLSFKRQDQSSLSSLGKNIFLSPQQPGSSTFDIPLTVPSLNGVLNGMGISSSNTTTEGAVTANANANTNGAATVFGSSQIQLIIEAVQLFSQADFDKALNLTLKLNSKTQQTPFILALKGRCCLEMLDYKQSVEQFRLLRQLQPDRAEDMEYYSTALWHLKLAPDLAVLAHELTCETSYLRKRWQSWCCLGNAFSLSHDIANALKCFDRACKLNPRNAYVYTLMGYEYISNEEHQNAVDAFLQALKIDPNRYNAWYGLGSVYYSLGRYDESLVHFKQALNLNPNNSVLLCLMGTVYEALDQPDLAMEAYTEACNLNPASPTARYRRSEALIAENRFLDAIQDLKIAETVAPEDYNIQILLGKAYKGIGKSFEALHHLTHALHLAPKSASIIKREMEGIS